MTPATACTDQLTTPTGKQGRLQRIKPKTSWKVANAKFGREKNHFGVSFRLKVCPLLAAPGGIQMLGTSLTGALGRVQRSCSRSPCWTLCGPGPDRVEIQLHGISVTLVRGHLGNSSHSFQRFGRLLRRHAQHFAFSVRRRTVPSHASRVSSQMHLQ